ncbi:MAG: acetyl-CoA decarbonylase/synthase complex subunit gamma [Candidatus Thermoplasmatota archaeon]|nr:acetyl-CoA decarbonylase/synthase complex subunit gamma [Candidatus Thermoplasmatota archaeon]
MPLTALEIYKHLPKKNCGECGVPTCLAFAMQLASLKTQLDKCPYVTEDAKLKLAEAAEPPIRLVKFGVGENELAIGDETVLFRHDKTFNHPTVYALAIDDTEPLEELKRKIELANNFRIERVGQLLKLDAVAIRNVSNDAKKFSEVTKLVQENTKLPLILMSNNSEAIEAGLKQSSVSKPLIYCATSDNFDAMLNLAKNYKCPLTISATNLDELVNLTQKAKGQVNDIVIDFGAKSLKEALETLTTIRRLAIKKSFRPLGYPVITILDTKDKFEAFSQASIYTMKYSSIVVFNELDWAMLLPLLALRQNIFTDPQKPIQVKPGIYEIGKPTANSPLLVTTNFSLTYFTVAGDTEKSKVPSWLLIVDTEGLSVMTAFAADKFTPELIAKTIESTGIKEKVAHNKIIIPGMVARMTIKLKELTGMEVLVGPRDSSGIPSYLKESWK